MRKLFWILGLLISVNMLTAGPIDPEEFYQTILRPPYESLEKMDLMLAQNPAAVKLDVAKTQNALYWVATTWCTNGKPSTETITKMTKLLVANLSPEEGVTAVRSIYRSYNQTKNELAQRMQKNLPTESLTLLLEKVGEMMKIAAERADLVGVASITKNNVIIHIMDKNVLFNKLKDLIDKAKNEPIKSNALDFLSKVRSINMMSLMHYEEQKPLGNKILEELSKAENIIVEKDKQLLKERIAETSWAPKKEFKPGFNIDNDADYFKATIYNFLLKNVEIEGDLQEALLSKVLLGTPERDYGDSLLAQARNIEGVGQETAGILTLLFAVGNNEVNYLGQMEETGELLVKFVTVSNPAYGKNLVEAALTVGLPAYKSGALNDVLFDLKLKKYTNVIEKAALLERSLEILRP
jgi:hypothetical protein